MKYLWKATREHVLAIIVYIAIIIADIYLNAKVLIWIQSALENYKDPIKWLALIVTEMVVVTLIEVITTRWSVFNAKVYTGLIRMYTNKLAYSDYDLYTKYAPGQLSTVIYTCKQISQIISNIIRIFTRSAKIIINLMMIFTVSSKMGFTVIAVYLIGAIIMRIPLKRWNELDKDFDNIRRSRNSDIDEIINGFSEIRSFAGLQAYKAETANNGSNKCLDILKKRAFVDASLTGIYLVVDSIGTLVMVIYGIYALQNGILTNASEALALVMFVWRLADPTISLIDEISNLSENMAPLKKFEEIMDYQNKVINGSVKLDKFENEISINRVSFAYRDSTNVLEDVSFKIHKGEHVGICGSSGGGKSTLLKLIPRFYDVDSGSITIDGINIKELDQQSMKSHIGIVNQDVFIFDGTIRDNIKYGCITREVSDNEIYEACRKVNLYDFIMSLPDKFDTNVGPRGLKLSGGQKQRLALARLFITNPDILILDEATSALDNETEKLIQDSLSAFADKTMIVVAHRLSTIKDSDNIIVIGDHKVLEQGNHDELMDLDGEYAKLVKAAEKNK